MSNIKEERGFFWWFNEPHGQTNSKETSVPGLLKISDEGHVSLELEGAMWSSGPTEPVSWRERRLLPLDRWITGRLGSYGAGGHVLLCRLERTDFSLDDELPRQQSYAAEFCLEESSEFTHDFNLDSFRQLKIELLGLEDWLELEGLKAESDFRSGNEREATIRYKEFECSYQLADDLVTIESMMLGLPIFGFLEGSEREIHLRQRNFLTYTPTSESNLEVFRYEFTRIEEVVSLLLGWYFRLDWPTLVRKDGESESWYRLYYQRGPRPEPIPIYYFAWTSFSGLRESFGTLFSSWKAHAEKYGAGDFLYLAALRNPLPYPEHEFVNLVWALESLHRTKQLGLEQEGRVREQREIKQRILNRFSGDEDKNDLKWLKGKLKYAEDPMLADRIFELFIGLPVPLKPKELRRFAGRCAQRRNDISHEGGPREDETYEEFLNEVSALRDAIRVLYHALLLDEIGVEHTNIAQTMTKSSLAENRILPALRNAGLTVLESKVFPVHIRDAIH